MSFCAYGLHLDSKYPGKRRLVKVCEETFGLLYQNSNSTRLSNESQYNVDLLGQVLTQWP